MTELDLHLTDLANAGGTFAGEPVKRCQHLGPPLENRSGITIAVKCDCNGSETQQFHAAHSCGWDGNRTNRCLPTLVPISVDRWNERPESKLYPCCNRCAVYQESLESADTTSPAELST